MRIVADSAIKLAREAFSALGDLVLLSADEINPRTIREANVLLVRTETRIDAALLSGSAVRFVATATTGTDHVDLHLLEEKGIAFSSAAGCNANAVCEYIVAILLSLAKERGWSLQGSTLGVVGVGKIGSRVARVGAALGMEVLKNDPPLARQSGSADFLELDDLMGVDYLTIHVPLTFRGADPTHHLFDEDRLERLKGATVLINTSRGSVVDGSALKQCLVRGRLSTCVLDVWEHEPGIDFSLLEKVSIGTPHIAGYSLDGKLKATQLVYESLCRFLETEPDWQPSAQDNRPIEARRMDLRGFSGGGQDAILRSVLCCYDPLRDDRLLRGGARLPAQDRPSYFKSLRREYPVRREFNNTTVLIGRSDDDLASILLELGFMVSDDHSQESLR